jgi:hypothetical protein
MRAVAATGGIDRLESGEVTIVAGAQGRSGTETNAGTAGLAVDVSRSEAED